MKRTKLVSLLLAAALLCSLLPVGASAAENILVSFDPNLPAGDIQTEYYPVRTSLQDILDNTQVKLPDSEEFRFGGWSTRPCSSRESTRGNDVPVSKNITLYAIWERKLTEASAFIEPGWWSSAQISYVKASPADWQEELKYETFCTGWWRSIEDVGDEEKIYDGAFEDGETYYASLYFKPDQNYAFTEGTVLTLSDNVELVSSELVPADYDGRGIDAVISYTHAAAPATVDSVELFVGGIWPEALLEWGCAQFCLTPGVETEPYDGWWDSAEDVPGEDCTEDEAFQAGKRYYSCIDLWVEEGSVFSADTQITLHGGEVISTELGEDYDGRQLNVVYAVDVPDAVRLTAMSSRVYEQSEKYEGAFWVDCAPYLTESIDDWLIPAGSHVYTALARPGYEFDGWYLYAGEGVPSASRILLSAEPVAELDVSAEDGILICRFRATQEESLPFTDVQPGAYYYDAVRRAYENGIANGVSKTSFAPGEACTRAQIVTFIWRANGCPEPSSMDCPFTDVKESAYYRKAVLWAVENSITNGITATLFGPNDPCTRAHAVTFLWRSVGCPAPRSTENPFTDVNETSYYYVPVLWALENGITKGTDATHFSPHDPCTRGQIVTFLYRLMQITT